MKGLEPPRRKAQDPKSCAATNYATSAFENPCKGIHFLFFKKPETEFLRYLISNAPSVAGMICK